MFTCAYQCLKDFYASANTIPRNIFITKYLIDIVFKAESFDKNTPENIVDCLSLLCLPFAEKNP